MPRILSNIAQRRFTLLPHSKIVKSQFSAWCLSLHMHHFSVAVVPLLVLFSLWGGARSQCTDRVADPRQCDAYTDCIRGIQQPALCPDGLVFSPEANGYPCLYPQEVDCSDRPATQPPQATADCPRQFAMLRLGDAYNCGQYMNCVHGKAHFLDCPEGLAFNEETLQCDWPDLVPTCNAEGFLGFSCPSTYHPTLGYPGGHTYYRSPSDCQAFFVCINDRPRKLRCPHNQAFNEAISACDGIENVTGCYVPDSSRSNTGDFNQVHFYK